MSRKPINVELKGLQTPRERVWNAILKLSHSERESFDKKTLQDHCNPMVRWTLVDDYLDYLEVGGHIMRVSGNGAIKGSFTEAIRFKLVKRQGEAPRINIKGGTVTQGAGTEAMWRAMKVLPVFDHHDIAKAATLGAVVVNLASAKNYVAHLSRAGYLTVVRAGKPGTPTQHKLSKNTGMHAPAITRSKAVFDRNTGQFASLNIAQNAARLNQNFGSVSASIHPHLAGAVPGNQLHNLGSN